MGEMPWTIETRSKFEIHPHNLTPAIEHQLIDQEQGQTVFTVLGTGSFASFPSFYMQLCNPTKLHEM
jgi:hypothetical protein